MFSTVKGFLSWASKRELVKKSELLKEVLTIKKADKEKMREIIISFK